MAHILVVDDDVGFLPPMAMALAAIGHSVTTSHSGPQVLEQDVRPDLALLDIRMPEMNGVTLAKKLKVRWPDLPVLFMTAGCGQKLRAKAERIGTVLEKPLSITRLEQAIRETLSATVG
jgi:two-component system, cell cycle sensor histidine kinase and response regulator CckA